MKILSILVSALLVVSLGCGPGHKTVFVGSGQASTAAPTPTGTSDGVTTNGIDVALTYRGDYSLTATYKAGDVVFFDGKLYFALMDNPGSIPGPEWELLNGTNGVDGASGPQGPAGADGVSSVTTVVVVITDNDDCDTDGKHHKHHKHHKHPPTQPGNSPNGPPGTEGNPNH